MSIRDLGRTVLTTRPFALTLTLGLAACGGSSKPAPPQPPVLADQCAQAGANTSRMLVESVPEATPALASEFGGAIERHCRSDAWTAQAQGCIAGAKDTDGMEACDPMLTQEQKDAVEQLSKVMNGNPRERILRAAGR
jgi:hypothetical protein